MKQLTETITTLFDLMWANWYQVVLNVVGGFITVAVIEVVKRVIAFYRSRRFLAVFGKDIFAANEFHLVYGALKLDVQDKRLTHPFVKPDQNDGSRFSIDYPVSQCELRAANYISTAIGSEAGSAPKMSS